MRRAPLQLRERTAIAMTVQMSRNAVAAVAVAVGCPPKRAPSAHRRFDDLSESMRRIQCPL